MKPLKPLESAFWQAYLGALQPSRRPQRPRVSAAFAGSRTVTDGLIRLYLRGKKTAGSSLAADFRSAGDPLPKAGDYWIVLDGLGRPRCLLRTVRTEVNVFKDIPARVAAAEGEGALSRKHWQRVHRRAYAPFLETWGIADLDEAEVVTEHFKLLHPPRPSPPRRRNPGPVLSSRP